MSRSEILYLLLFIGCFRRFGYWRWYWIASCRPTPAFTPHRMNASGNQSVMSFTPRVLGSRLRADNLRSKRLTKQGEKERVATLPRSKSEEAYRARAAAALVAAVRPTAPSLDGNRPMHPLRFAPSAIAPASSWTFAIHRDLAYPPGMKEHIYGYAAILAALLSLPSLAAKLRNDDHVPDEDH